MSIMIPDYSLIEFNSTAEKRIFEQFKYCKGTDDWIVLHSLGISSHTRRNFGEIDFLVLAPNLGVFVIEVKGGRVSRNNGLWSFTDRFGRTNEKSFGPFEQAQDAMNSLIKYILKQNILSSRIKNILFGYGVIFPDIEFNQKGIDFEEQQIQDASNNRNIYEFIKQLSAYYSKKPNNGYRVKPTSSEIKEVVSLLRFDFDIPLSLVSIINQSEDKLVKFTNEQYRYLDQIADNSRVFVQGFAGTGKTILAMETFRRFFSQGLSVGLICYNKNLGKWLQSQLKELEGEEFNKSCYVGTIHSLMLRVSGLSMDLTEITEDSVFFEEKLPIKAAETLMINGSLFDVIIIDEAQDIISDNNVMFIDACIKKGIDRGRWYIFGDFFKQTLYDRDLSFENVIEYLNNLTNFTIYRLKINCRNTINIGNEIRNLLNIRNDIILNNIEGPKVEYISWFDKSDQKRKLVKRISDLIQQGFKYSDITILSVEKFSNSVVSTISEIRIKEYPADDMRIAHSTIHSFKGLENKIIVITDIKNYIDEKLTYVGFSRARSMLIVFEYVECINERISKLLREE